MIRASDFAESRFDVPVLIIKDSRNARKVGLQIHLFYSVAFLGDV